MQPGTTASPRTALVADALEGFGRPALVVGAGPIALDGADDLLVRRLDDPPLDEEALEQVRTVLLVVADVAELRAAVGRLPALGRARFVGCVVEHAEAAAVLRPRPTWPDLVDLDARLVDGAAVTVVRLAARVDAAEVLTELARGRAQASDGHDGVRVRRAGGYHAEEKVPPDVLVADGADGLPPSPVLDRAPVVLGPEVVGEPVDEGIFNPVGFRRDWSRGVLDLDPTWAPTPALLAGFRDVQGVRVPDGADPHLVACLAAGGVPLVRPGDDVDLDDPLRREEHSVRQRRESLVAHARPGWGARVAERAGIRAPAYPSVSVLLATRRPELLDFALGQVAKQRQVLPGAEVELVLVGHGFEPDAARVRTALGGRAHTVLTRPGETLFGDVLRAASDAASGDVVLKMDDDDWYGPDVVTDLLLARRYSGAELVGMPAEMVYLEPIRTTVRRRGPSENYGDVVAGGTMLLDRSLLREVGGFRPVRRFLDAQLLDAVRAAGGRTYRTHGLGYLLRRGSGGHTWDPGLGYFLSRRAVAAQWRGFRPSALLEHDESEAP